MFLIKLTVDRQVALGISDLSWSVAESQTVPTKVIFDHTLIYDGPSIAISKDVFYLELKNAHASLKRMQSAKMALFELKEQSIFFELAGVKDAVGALIDCVKQGKLNMKDT